MTTIHIKIIIAFVIISVNIINCDIIVKKDVFKAKEDLVDKDRMQENIKSNTSEINIDLQHINNKNIESEKLKILFDTFLKEISKFKDIDRESDISAVTTNKTNILVKIYELGSNSNENNGEYKMRQSNQSLAIAPPIETNKKPLNHTNLNNKPENKDIVNDFFKINQDRIDDQYHNDHQNRIPKENNLKSLLIDLTMNYDTNENDNDTDYSYPDIDYLEIYEDTMNDDAPAPYLTRDVTTSKTDIYDSTGEDNENVKIEDEFENITFSTCHGAASDLKSAVYPWIATIFVTDTDDTFIDDFISTYKYVCDGVLVKPDTILTSARCLINGTLTINPVDILVSLGEYSIDSDYGRSESVSSIAFSKEVQQEGTAVPDDLAILLLSSAAAAPKIGSNIKTACIKTGQEVTQKSTFYTFGRRDDKLIKIKLFEASSTNECQAAVPGTQESAKRLCFKYSTEITTCPSHGGILFEITESNRIYLRGIRYSSNTNLENYCFGNYIIFSRVDSEF